MPGFLYCYHKAVYSVYTKMAAFTPTHPAVMYECYLCKFSYVYLGKVCAKTRFPAV
jgi:hypothetical protein